VDQRFFIPSHDFMAKLAHNLEYNIALDRHAFGEVNGFGKRSYTNMHFAAGPDYRGKPSPCSNAGKQKLGIEFAHLILNWHEQCSFVWLHILAWLSLSLQIKPAQGAS
jgi:hypothetical protein